MRKQSKKKKERTNEILNESVPNNQESLDLWPLNLMPRSTAAKTHRIGRQASPLPEQPIICRRHEPSLVVQTTRATRSYLHRHTFFNATAFADGSETTIESERMGSTRMVSRWEGSSTTPDAADASSGSSVANPRTSEDPSTLPHTQSSEISFQSDNGSSDVPSSSAAIVDLTQRILSSSPPSSQYKVKSRLNTIKSSIRKITSQRSSNCRTYINTIPTIPQAQENEIINTTANPHHPIVQVFREEQLGRNIFVMAVPIATGFMAYYNLGSLPLAGRLAAAALSVGSAAVFNGILLRKAFPKASNTLELLGVALMLIAFFGYLGSSLPEGYLWLPVLCCVACLVPLGVAICGCKENNAGENGGDDDDVPAALCLV